MVARGNLLLAEVKTLFELNLIEQNSTLRSSHAVRRQEVAVEGSG